MRITITPIITAIIRPMGNTHVVNKQGVMNDKTIEFDQTKDRLILTYEVSDEALEVAAMSNGKSENLTLSFCSTPWTCPTNALASGR